MPNKDFENGLALGLSVNGVIEKDRVVSKTLLNNGEYTPSIENDEAVAYDVVTVNVQAPGDGLPLDLAIAAEIPEPTELENEQASVKYIFPNATAAVTGTVDVGQTVSLTMNNVNDYAIFSYQWMRGLPVPCLTSTGTQYINSGLNASSYTSVEMEFVMTDTPNAYSALFGSRVGSDNNGLNYQNHCNGNLYVKQLQNYNEASKTFTNNFYRTYTHLKYNSETVTVTLQDSEGHREYLHGNFNNWSNSLPMYIFGVNTNNSAAHDLSALKVIYCRFWNGDTLARSFVPALSDEEGHVGEACFYDRVTKQYYYNASGTGSFTYETVLNSFENISGATTSTYTVVSGDQGLKCHITDSDNTEINIYSDEKAVESVGNATVINDLATQITGTSEIVGSTLTVQSDEVDVTKCNKQWQRGLTYIEPSKHNSYFDLGVTPNQEWKYNVIVSNITNSDQTIFSATSSWDCSYMMMYYASNYLRWGTGSGQQIISGHYVGTNTAKRLFNIECHHKCMTVNGDIISTDTSNGAAISSTLQLYRVGSGYYGTHRLHRFKAWDDNSVLQFDLVPAISNETGHEREACLYNNVTNSYVYATSGAFKYGNDDSNFEDIAGQTSTTYVASNVRDYIRCKLTGNMNDSTYGDTSSNVKLVGKDISLLRSRIAGGTTTVLSSSLTSSGTQYINTGVASSNNIKIQVKLNWQEVTGSIILGNHLSEQQCFRLFNYGNNFYLDYGNAEGNRIYGGSFALNTDYEIEIGNRYVKDLVTGNNIISGSECTFSFDEPIYLFGDVGGPTKGTIYYCKIHDGDTLVRELVPALSDEEGHAEEPCFYDTVSETYFYNQGTGRFTYYELVDSTIEVGSPLHIESDTIDLSQVAYNWYKGADFLGYSHTNNIDDDGTQHGNYGSNEDWTKTVNIPVASTVTVKTQYATENGCDWVRIHNGLNTSSPEVAYYSGGWNTPELVVPNCSSLTFHFHSDGSVSNYGYYSVITANSKTDLDSHESTYTPVDADLDGEIGCLLVGTSSQFNESVAVDRPRVIRTITVTFMVGDQVYDVRSGEVVYAPDTPESPDPQTPTFGGWYDEDDNKITFPHRGTSLTVYAKFINIPESMIMNNAGTVVILGGRTYTKTTDEFCIVGYGFSGGYTGPVMASNVSPTAVTWRWSGGDATYSGTIEYKGETWYIGSSGAWWGGNCDDTSGLNRYKLTNTSSRDVLVMGRELLEAAYGS